MVSNFGGEWTQKKLNCLKNYLTAYKKVMKNQNFKLLYIDAFAGAGYREIEDDDLGVSDFFKGSPLMALEHNFTKFFFIEKDKNNYKELKKLLDKDEYQKNENIEIFNEDANIRIPKVCKTVNWSDHRAIFFLDPFAMEVKWETIKSIAETKAIDLWLLFPAMAVNRLLYKNGKIPSNLQMKLDTVFGTNTWKDEFYGEPLQGSLFNDNKELEKRANFEAIKSFYRERLREIFPGVANNPLPLKNKTNSILFYLYFALSNDSKKAKRIALKIAQHILGSE